MKWTVSDERLEELIEDVDEDELDELVEAIRGYEEELRALFAPRALEIVIRLTDRRPQGGS